MKVSGSISTSLCVDGVQSGKLWLRPQLKKMRKLAELVNSELTALSASSADRNVSGNVTGASAYADKPICTLRTADLTCLFGIVQYYVIIVQCC